MKHLSLLLFASLLSVSTNAQQSKKMIIQTVECKGWTVPLFNNVTSETEIDGFKEIEGVKVERKIHKLSSEQLVYLETCNAKQTNHNAERRAFTVKDFVTYEVNGKIFAYEIFYHLVDVKNEAITERYLATTSRFYSDEDGDGTFEIQIANQTGAQTLPIWVKN